MIHIITFISFFTFVNALLPSFTNRNIQNPLLQIKNGYVFTEQPDPLRKVRSYFKLFRANNILPTSVLCFTGGLMTNPNLGNLMQSPSFLTSAVTTNLIMMSSMVLNDLYDFDIDKINNPTRPLITGEISRKSAAITVSVLLLITEFLTLKYLPATLQILMQLITVTILIYTPILKRIPLIKNVACASLVSFSLYFNGLAANTMILGYPKYKILEIASRIVFFGSFVNEILLDIRDYHGDKLNHIHTIPVIFGNNNAFICASIFLTTNMIWNILEFSKIHGPIKAAILLLPFLPLYKRMYDMSVYYYSIESILKYTNQSTRSMLFILALIIYM
jgi:4-hydroxybenzoate polyprenyltransferase